jgi:hypothetical protein
MAHFAELDQKNEIIKVIVVHNSVLEDENGDEQEQLGIDYLTSLFPETWWKQTSYNASFRKNFAGVGMKYDGNKDLFYDPVSPFPSWEYDEDTGRWNPPVAHPADGKEYIWNEPTTNWKERE